MTEFEHAKWLADKLLDDPHADPDDDLRTLSRQFLRALEREAVARADERRVVLEILSYWIEHSTLCIRAHCNQGRPTKEGGYEQNYRGKWYQSLPVDQTPKCDCGLDDIIESLKKSVCGSVYLINFSMLLLPSQVCNKDLALRLREMKI